MHAHRRGSTATSQSSSPAESASACARANNRPQVPSAFHLVNRSYAVCHGPNCSGSSRHGEPVRYFQAIA
jgi:hypothetical protein